MNIYNELLKEILENGTLEEKVFAQRMAPNSKERDETAALLTSVVQNLYEQGYTPAEVKGCLQVAARITDFQKLKR